MTTTKDRVRRGAAALVAAGVLAAGCGDDGGSSAADAASTNDMATGDPGIDTTGLSATIDNPYVAFASVTRAVYEGSEVDEDTGETVTIRVESVPRGETTRVAGVDVAIVDVTDVEDGAAIEETEDYYAQGPDGAVYYFGERVDDIEDGEVVGHHGQWLAGEDGNQAGVFMPAELNPGVVFEQERVPGVAEDRSTVVNVGLTVTVPAGTFTDCIETEDLDPLDDVTEHKFYCSGVGLVREVFPSGSIDLVELERTG